MFYVATVWALAIFFVKVEEKTIAPITIMAGRAFLAFITVFIASIIVKKNLVGNLKYVGSFLFFAILGIVLVWIGLAFGQEYISVGLGSVLVTTMPLLTFIITVLILRVERFSLTGILGLILGIAGIALVIGINNILEGGSMIEGVLLVGGGFVCLAVNGVLMGKYTKGIDPLITTTYILSLGAAILIALAFTFEHPDHLPWTRDNILSELALGVICTASGYFGYFYLIHKAGAYFSSFIFYFIPIVGLMLGHFILKEKVASSQIIGVAVILIGVYLTNRETLKKI